MSRVGVTRYRAEAGWAVVLHAAAIAVLLVVGLVRVATHDGGTSTALDTITSADLSAAVAASRSAETAAYDITVTVAGGEQKIKLGGDGALDFARNRSSVRIEMPEKLQVRGISAIESVSDGSSIWVRVPEAAVQLNRGKPWASAPAPKSATLSADPLSDPSAFLDQLTKVGGEVQTKGREKVRGVTTTRYHAQLPLAKVLSELAPDERAKLEPLLTQGGVGAFDVDVWVDDEKLLRRMEFGVGGEGFSFTMRMELYDFGKPVSITIPPAAQTRRFGSLQALAAALSLPFGGISG